jgi:tetratricopeptide (TPR) repeat protein
MDAPLRLGHHLVRSYLPDRVLMHAVGLGASRFIPRRFGAFISYGVPIMESHDVAAAGAVSLKPAVPKLRDRKGFVYEPAIGPRLKVLLFVIFASVALLGATGVYLLSISALEWYQQQRTYQTGFSLWMLFTHVLVGVVMLVPFVVFGSIHLMTARHRKNRRAVKLGIIVFISGLVVVVTGVALIQIFQGFQLPEGSLSRRVVYWLHILVPVFAVVMYILHRRAGPDIKWSWGYTWGGFVAIFVVGMGALHIYNPRDWGRVGSREGIRYFYPSEAITSDGNFIDANVLMADTYCMKCHEDIYNDHFHSAHKFSSFNNPAYLFSVEETRKVSLKRDGNVKASRWCAGCHDPVPFFSGQFDDPEYDIRNHPTSQAGITCTVCHAISNVNSPIGNAAYTITEPEHYPFAFSDNSLLQWINNQWIKAKPDFHRRTFLKPFHRNAMIDGPFCSTCHKVSLPVALNHYKDFLRGQNHHDDHHLSGVGHGARSYYFPPQAKAKCAECHMPLEPSNDFGTKDFDGSGIRKRHHHGFPAANTGLFAILSMDPKHADHKESFERAVQLHTDFLRDKKLRIDLFGIKEGGTIKDKLAVLRPELPKLKPGQKYLVEVVVRTLNMGHPFTQGTVDSNEIWVDFEAKADGRVIGRNGALSGPDDTGQVDEWSNFVNVLMLDNDGHRINRRNPQDIFTPLYNHQIPPGAAQVVHYSLDVPRDVKGPVELRVRLRYRKFDFEYMSLVFGGASKVPKLPIVDICEDKVTLPVEGVPTNVPEQKSPIEPAWQRWNDYGIGCHIEGGVGLKKGELRQAEEAFEKLVTLEQQEPNPNGPHAHGYMNLARVLIDEGRFREAEEALRKATEAGAPWWLVRWFGGLVNVQNGHLEEATRDFEEILDLTKQPRDRKFDFTSDYIVINASASTLFKRAQLPDGKRERDELLRQAVKRYEDTLKIDPENLDAHYGLRQCFERLSEGAYTDDRKSVAMDDAELLPLAEAFANPKSAKDDRLQEAWRLSQAIKAVGERPVSPAAPKVPALTPLMPLCTKVFLEDGDVQVRTAAAYVLGHLHRELHSIYNPDENAKNSTVQKYRSKHPAANAAAEAIVIYPTAPDQPDPNKPRPGFE